MGNHATFFEGARLHGVADRLRNRFFGHCYGTASVNCAPRSKMLFCSTAFFVAATITVLHATSFGVGLSGRGSVHIIDGKFHLIALNGATSSLVHHGFATTLVAAAVAHLDAARAFSTIVLVAIHYFGVQEFACIAFNGAASSIAASITIFDLTGALGAVIFVTVHNHGIQELACVTLDGGFVHDCINLAASSVHAAFFQLQHCALVTLVLLHIMLLKSLFDHGLVLGHIAGFAALLHEVGVHCLATFSHGRLFGSASRLSSLVISTVVAHVGVAMLALAVHGHMTTFFELQDH